MAKIPPYVRLMRKFVVDPVTGCWNWQASKDKGGYGSFRFGRKVGSHKASYLFHVGPVPRGYELDHLCRNRGCGNPLHLEAVTHKVNMQRAVRTKTRTTGTRTTTTRIRKIHTHCKNGHELAGTNLVITKRGGYRRCRTCIRVRCNADYYKREVLNRPPAVVIPKGRFPK